MELFLHGFLYLIIISLFKIIFNIYNERTMSLWNISWNFNAISNTTKNGIKYVLFVRCVNYERPLMELIREIGFDERKIGSYR